MPRAAMLPTAAMAAMAVTHIWIIIMITFTAALVATEAMAAAVPVPALAHAAAMEVQAVPEALDMNGQALALGVLPMAITAVQAVQVLPLEPWANSIGFSPSSTSMPRAEV